MQYVTTTARTAPMNAPEKKDPIEIMVGEAGARGQGEKSNIFEMSSGRGTEYVFHKKNQFAAGI
jgi:hypothetical protein